MIDPLDDGDLAQARHQVRLLQQAVREAQAVSAERAVALAREIQLRREAERDRALALRLRDASALEHERERTRRQAGDALLEEAADILELEGYDERAKDIRAHLTRQGETT